jgi:hypothetical protein
MNETVRLLMFGVAAVAVIAAILVQFDWLAFDDAH